MRQFRVVVNGNEYKVAIEELEDTGGQALTASTPAQTSTNPPPGPPSESAKPKRQQAKPAAAKPAGGAGAPGNIMAAMPGTILDVHVSVGDSVTRGQSLLVLEAMKMENDVMAPVDGVVEVVHIDKGSSVNSGDLLMVIA